MTIKVDLLPTEKPGFQFDPLVLVLFVFVVASSGVCWYYGQTVEQEIKVIDEKRVVVESKIKELETSKKAIEKEREKLAKLTQQFQLVKSLMHDPLKYANLMSEVSALLPDSVFIDNLNIDPGPNTVTFSGTAAGNLPLSIVAATMKNFNESAYFDGTTLQSCSRKGDGEDVFSFSMTVHFDPNAATDKAPGTKDSAAGAAPVAPPPVSAPEPDTSSPAPSGSPTP